VKEDPTYQRLAAIDANHPIHYVVNSDTGNVTDVYVDIGYQGAGLSNIVSSLTGNARVTKKELSNMHADNIDLVGNKPGNVWAGSLIRANTIFEDTFGPFNQLTMYDFADAITLGGVTQRNLGMVKYNKANDIL
jgi:hypothetical protein